MEIKGVRQIKKELAKHYRYTDWSEMLRNSGDWSHDKYVDVVAEEYASQFQLENKLLRGMMREVKNCLIKCNEVIKLLDSTNSDMKNEITRSTKCPDNRRFVEFNSEIEALINKDY